MHSAKADQDQAQTMLNCSGQSQVEVYKNGSPQRIKPTESENPDGTDMFSFSFFIYFLLLLKATRQCHIKVQSKNNNENRS